MRYKTLSKEENPFDGLLKGMFHTWWCISIIPSTPTLPQLWRFSTHAAQTIKLMAFSWFHLKFHWVKVTKKVIIRVLNGHHPTGILKIISGWLREYALSRLNRLKIRVDENENAFTHLLYSVFDSHYIWESFSLTDRQLDWHHMCCTLLLNVVISTTKNHLVAFLSHFETSVSLFCFFFCLQKASFSQEW